MEEGDGQDKPRHTVHYSEEKTYKMYPNGYDVNICSTAKAAKPKVEKPSSSLPWETPKCLCVNQSGDLMSFLQQWISLCHSPIKP